MTEKIKTIKFLMYVKYTLGRCILIRASLKLHLHLFQMFISYLLLLTICTEVSTGPLSNGMCINGYCGNVRLVSHIVLYRLKPTKLAMAVRGHSTKLNADSSKARDVFLLVRKYLLFIF